MFLKQGLHKNFDSTEVIIKTERKAGGEKDEV